MKIVNSLIDSSLTEQKQLSYMQYSVERMWPTHGDSWYYAWD